MAVENIDHTKTKVKSPQTNGIVERLHKTLLAEFYRVTFRKKVNGPWRSCRRTSMPSWSTDNLTRPHQGRWS